MTSQKWAQELRNSRYMGLGTKSCQYRRGQGSPAAGGISFGGNARWLPGSRYMCPYVQVYMQPLKQPRTPLRRHAPAGYAPSRFRPGSQCRNKKSQSRLLVRWKGAGDGGMDGDDGGFVSVGFVLVCFWPDSVTHLDNVQHLDWCRAEGYRYRLEL